MTNRWQYMPAFVPMQPSKAELRHRRKRRIRKLLGSNKMVNFWKSKTKHW